MQRLEVSGAVRLIYKSLGVKGLNSLSDTHSSETFAVYVRVRFFEVIRLKTCYIVLFVHLKCRVSHSIL